MPSSYYNIRDLVLCPGTHNSAEIGKPVCPFGQIEHDVGAMAHLGYLKRTAAVEATNIQIRVFGKSAQYNCATLLLLQVIQRRDTLEMGLAAPSR